MVRIKEGIHPEFPCLMRQLFVLLWEENITKRSTQKLKFRCSVQNIEEGSSAYLFLVSILELVGAGGCVGTVLILEICLLCS